MSVAFLHWRTAQNAWVVIRDAASVGRAEISNRQAVILVRIFMIGRHDILKFCPAL
jgi:hypothetical protein